MSTIYELHTNEGIFLVRSKPTSTDAMAYTKKKMAEGRSLSSIIFCHTPRHVMQSVPRAWLLK